MINHNHKYEITGTSELVVSKIGGYQNEKFGIKKSEHLQCSGCGFRFTRSVTGIEFRSVS